MQSRHLRKWCNKIGSIVFSFLCFARDEQKNKCGGVIVIQFCIFYHIHTMHIVNKNVIFNLFLSIFAGPHLNEEEAQNLFNYQELKENKSKPKRNQSPKESPKVEPRI